MSNITGDVDDVPAVPGCSDCSHLWELFRKLQRRLDQANLDNAQMNTDIWRLKTMCIRLLRRNIINPPRLAGDQQVRTQDQAGSATKDAVAENDLKCHEVAEANLEQETSSLVDMVTAFSRTEPENFSPNNSMKKDSPTFEAFENALKLSDEELLRLLESDFKNKTNPESFNGDPKFLTLQRNSPSPDSMITQTVIEKERETTIPEAPIGSSDNPWKEFVHDHYDKIDDTDAKSIEDAFSPRNVLLPDRAAKTPKGRPYRRLFVGRESVRVCPHGVLDVKRRNGHGQEAVTQNDDIPSIETGAAVATESQEPKTHDYGAGRLASKNQKPKKSRDSGNTAIKKRKRSSNSESSGCAQSGENIP